MRRLVATVLALAGSGWAAAQAPPLVQATPNPGDVFNMPGVPVGTSIVQPVGGQVPKAVPAAGTPVGTAPSGVPVVSPQAGLPQGSIDPAAIVGPVPPTQTGPTDPTVWDKFVSKYGARIGLIAPEPKAPNVTPGIFRRNRERARLAQIRARD